MDIRPILWGKLFPDSTPLWEEKAEFIPIFLSSHSVSLHLLLSVDLTCNPDFSPFFSYLTLSQEIKHFVSQL